MLTRRNVLGAALALPMMGGHMNSRRNYDVAKSGIKYGPESWQAATVYRPAVPGTRPAAVMVHGGGWTGGGRASFDPLAAEWASRGFVVYNIDYYRNDEPELGRIQLKDVATAIARVDSDPKVNSSKIIMVGESAGGQLAATAAVKSTAVAVRGAVVWSPVASPWNAYLRGLEPREDVAEQEASLGRRAQKYFGYSQGLGQTTAPFRYIAAGYGVPMWIAVSKDEWVDPTIHGEQLRSYLTNADLQNEYKVVDGTLHADKLRNATPALTEDAYSFMLDVMKP